MHIIHPAEDLYLENVKCCQISIRKQTTLLRVGKRFEHILCQRTYADRKWVLKRCSRLLVIKSQWDTC